MFKFLRASSLKPIHISENIVKNLTDLDPQKNFLILATKIAELQEQHRLTQTKTNELEKTNNNSNA